MLRFFGPPGIIHNQSAFKKPDISQKKNTCVSLEQLTSNIKQLEKFRKLKTGIIIEKQFSGWNITLIL